MTADLDECGAKQAGVTVSAFAMSLAYMLGRLAKLPERLSVLHDLRAGHCWCDIITIAMNIAIRVQHRFILVDPSVCRAGAVRSRSLPVRYDHCQHCGSL